MQGVERILDQQFGRNLGPRKRENIPHLHLKFKIRHEIKANFQIVEEENEKFTIDDDGVTRTSTTRKGEEAGHRTEAATQQSHQRKCKDDGRKTILIVAHHFPIEFRIVTLF